MNSYYTEHQRIRGSALEVSHFMLYTNLRLTYLLTYLFLTLFQIQYKRHFRSSMSSQLHQHYVATCQYNVSAYRYIAITNLPITPVFVEYLRQFLIDFNQIYRHSSVPKTRLRAFFELFSSSGFRARRRRDFFCHFVRTTVQRIPRLPHTSILWLN